jgi:hypothetical protein
MCSLDEALINVGEIEDDAEIDRTVQQDPTSSEVFDQLKFWLSVCASRHEKCNKYLGSITSLPSRVLKIGALESDIVYLEQHDNSSHLSEPYAALSHCWGTGQPFITTSETIEERQQGIHVNQLPQTYQDAITVARAIGLQYIWIDSLCIIQNDLLDWQHEAAKMASVYRNANIVIGAANASADSEGFLHRRTTEMACFGEKIHVSLLPPKAQRLSDESEPVKEEPLSARAWTLQEQYLPHRMISYGKNHVFWECSEMIASEDGDCVSRESDRLGLVTKTAAVGTSIFGISGRSPGDVKDTNYFDWYETVKGYVERHITKPGDRLPALSGLAKAVGEVTGDEYLAGVWKKGLIEGLLWRRVQEDQYLTKPEYRAPSWSWASVDGLISFTVYSFYDRSLWKAKMANFEPTVTFVDSFLQPLGVDLYGGIKSGWIRLKAPLYPITSIKNWDNVSYCPPGVMMDPLRSPACDKVFEAEIQHRGKTKRLWLDGGFDTSETLSGDGKLFALFLARLPDPGSSSGYYLDIRFGLILESLGSRDEFRRVGIIDGSVKIHKSNLMAKLQRKLYLEPILFTAQEGDECMPNLLGPDPYEGLEQSTVTIF